MVTAAVCRSASRGKVSYLGPMASYLYHGHNSLNSLSETRFSALSLISRSQVRLVLTFRSRIITAQVLTARVVARWGDWLATGHVVSCRVVGACRQDVSQVGKRYDLPGKL